MEFAFISRALVTPLSDGSVEGGKNNKHFAFQVFVLYQVVFLLDIAFGVVESLK